MLNDKVDPFQKIDHPILMLFQLNQYLGNSEDKKEDSKNKY
jgi:hypothetical protein